MSLWQWFTTYFLGSAGFWLLLILLVSTMSGASVPFARRVRLWQSKRRFMAAQSERGHAAAHFGLGKCLYREGRQEQAIEAYRGTLGENQSMLEVYFRLAQAAAMLDMDGEVDAARSEFRRVAATLPRFAGRQ